MPSKDESFCYAIAEALNHQRIPIMTATPSLNELYLSQGAGLGIKPEERNAQGIALIVNRALATMNQRSLKIIARRGRELVKKKYGLKQALRNQIKMYEEVLSTAAGSRGRR